MTEHRHYKATTPDGGIALRRTATMRYSFACLFQRITQIRTREVRASWSSTRAGASSRTRDYCYHHDTRLGVVCEAVEITGAEYRALKKELKK